METCTGKKSNLKIKHKCLIYCTLNVADGELYSFAFSLRGSIVVIWNKKRCNTMTYPYNNT